MADPNLSNFSYSLPRALRLVGPYLFFGHLMRSPLSDWTPRLSSQVPFAMIIICWQNLTMKTFSVSVFALAILLFLLGGFGFVLNKEAAAPIKLESLIDEDLENLSSKGLLPKEMNSLAEVELNAGTDNAKSWLKDMRFPFKVQKEGTHKLEVLLVDWTEGPKDGAMLQLNLIEKSSGNMVWELGRTFILKDRESSYQKLKAQLLNWLRH